LLQAAQDSEQLRLVFDAHTSIAFASGSILDVKSGRDIEIEQRGAKGREVWSATDREPESSWPAPTFDVEVVGEGKDAAVTIGLTHDIQSRVDEHIRKELGVVGRIIHCAIPSGAGQTAVKCGRHAFDIVESVARQVAQVRQANAFGHLHLFVAAPNVVTFFLGQRHSVLGPVTLYEYDFERSKTGGYEPSLSLPISFSR
jgi:hypothetical protein